LVLALVSLPLLKWIALITEWVMSDRSGAKDKVLQTSALDTSTLDQPSLALTCVTREVLKMGEETETALRSVIALFDDWDDETAEAIGNSTVRVQELHEGIKRFLAQLDHKQLDKSEKQRSSELANIAYSVETAADAVGTSLVDLARQLHAGQLMFSDDGLSDIQNFHERVLGNVQLALSVLMNGAPDAARQLFRAKEKVYKAERKLQEKHLARLRAGNNESFETSRLHQECLRILKYVNSSFATFGYSIATRSGDLLSTRLSKKIKPKSKDGQKKRSK
ncbi:MAG: Na/Pi cotransporter family protein, partial [Alphaproteobacteria bacterium]